MGLETNIYKAFETNLKYIDNDKNEVNPLDDKKYTIGDKVYLLTTHEDGLMNRWDKFVGIREEIVEGSWDILGRGCHH